MKIGNDLSLTLKENMNIPSNITKINRSGDVKKQWLIQKKFQVSSYGFRPGKSAHGALIMIKRCTTNTPWILDYGIKKAFPSVNRRRRISILRKHLTPEWIRQIEKIKREGNKPKYRVTGNWGTPGQHPIALPFQRTYECIGSLHPKIRKSV